jgi:mRNA interferase YafQ
LDLKLKLLGQDPWEPSLKSHKVNTELFGKVFSSSVTSDLRIIWNYNKNTKLIEVLELLDIGGHD